MLTNAAYLFVKSSLVNKAGIQICGIAEKFVFWIKQFCAMNENVVHCYLCIKKTDIPPLFQNMLFGRNVKIKYFHPFLGKKLNACMVCMVKNFTIDSIYQVACTI